jgi:hypothetical protein
MALAPLAAFSAMPWVRVWSPMTSVQGEIRQRFVMRCSPSFIRGSALLTQWFAVLDINLPLIVAAAQIVACVHVPGHYLSNQAQVILASSSIEKTLARREPMVMQRH